MSTCAQITNLTSDLSAVGGGSNDPVTGGQGLLLSNTPLDECTGVILLSAQDYAQMRFSFFSGVELMDVVQVSGLVSLVWAIAWGLRSLRSVL